MQIIRSVLFNRFPGIACGMNTKIGLDRHAPFYFNLSYSVGDDSATVTENRKAFWAEFGLTESQIAFQKQIHSDIITYTNKPGNVGESDALITDVPGLGIAVSTADCTPVLIYDPVKKIIAAVHSGWRGTQKRILEKTLKKLLSEFGSSVNDLFIFIAPSISQKNYEVGEEVAALFTSKYLKPNGGKYLLDVKGVNYDILIENGIPENQIELNDLCTYEEKNLLHSYRRDGKQSGRAMCLLVMRNDN